MFAGITIPLAVLFFDSVFLLLFKGIYLLLIRSAQRSEPFSIQHYLFITAGVQLGLLLLLLALEIVLNPHGKGWEDFVLGLAFTSTFAVPLFLLIRHHWRTSV
ncbi:hypothetical protein HER32_02005 [Hymenobacter sp. BT18]|uniref:hypothetical protein n=1 Tax=Hymenobacter sp. BT18 TaxID=2835648 RepID=UPI00143E0FE1|nr:hypothetical protein [Hymenobacter sp. BT18]QIX60028.1 hypothetical protein HER32_02005 [Hymenobacter sp. BT18]